MWGSQLFQCPILDLLHTVKTGETAFDHIFGQDVFGYLAEHPEDAAIISGYHPADVIARITGLWRMPGHESVPTTKRLGLRHACRGHHDGHEGAGVRAARQSLH
jgi:hypothetical protein